MRSIKFRAICQLDNTFKYGCLLNKIDIGEGCWIVEGKTHWMIEPETIGQFTGLHDSKGKEIYEGDIVKTIHNDVYVIKFGNHGTNGDDCYSGYAYGYFGKTIKEDVNSDERSLVNLTQYLSIEIIGNLMENPELLETK